MSITCSKWLGCLTSTGGGGFEFGVDPNDDPELALALRVSMEEQRARQQAEGGETNFCQASGLIYS